MNQNYWLIILFVAAMACNGNCRTRELSLKDLRPVYRSEKQLETAPNSSGASPHQGDFAVNNGDPGFNIESIATVARASSNGPSAPSSTVIGHFVDAVHQMVDSDMRTPPKLKEILKEKNTEKRDVLGEEYKAMPVTFIYEDDDDDDRTYHHNAGGIVVPDASERKASTVTVAKVVLNDGNKGIAIPVVMDDSEEPTEQPKKLQKIAEAVKPVNERRKAAVTKIHSTTTPSSGLSTWILLSDNRDVTTVSPKKNTKKEVANNGTVNGAGTDDKRKQTAASVVSTTKKPPKAQPTTTTAPKATVAVKKITTKVTSTRKPDAETTATSPLAAMIKNQKKSSTPPVTPSPSSTTATQKTKTTDTKTTSQKRPQTDLKKKGSENVPETKEKTEVHTLPPRLVLTTEDPVNGNNQETTETNGEGTTKKKKTSSKKKKKNKKKTKKPDTGIEPKIPTPAVGSQIYNFLSREIVPTVGLGLIGVALTAGLASFLGYNPFVSTTVPLRRTYESSHGYSPSNYYNYNTDYSDGGQSEEVLLREVLSGMPEESRYGLTHGDSGYSDSYSRKDQTYAEGKSPVYSPATGSSYEKESSSNYDSGYSQDYSSYGTTYDAAESKYPTDYNEKFPVYTRQTGTSFVYPETTGLTSAEKAIRVGVSDESDQTGKNEKFTKSSSDTIERQPEALYRVAGDTDLQYRQEGSTNVQGVNSQTNWHRMGTPLESSKPYARLEPGPRSLSLDKETAESDEKKRTKRDTDNIQRIARKRTKKENDAENEVDFEVVQDNKADVFNLIKAETTTQTTSTTARTTTTTTTTTTEKPETSTNEMTKENTQNTGLTKEEEYPTEPYPIEDEGSVPISSTASVMDILKRLAQFKLRLGLNFLRSTTDMFSRYLDAIQRKVDESFINTTAVHYNREKNPWSRIFYGRRDDNHLRRRRSALRENPILASLLAEEAKHSTGYSKSTKKELKLSDKIFHNKKIFPKKYQESKSRL